MTGLIIFTVTGFIFVMVVASLYWRYQISLIHEFADALHDYLRKPSQEDMTRIAKLQVSVQDALDGLKMGSTAIYPAPMFAGRMPIKHFEVADQVFDIVDELNTHEALFRHLHHAGLEGERRARRYLRNAPNPIAWVSMLVFPAITALPFWILRQAGFRTSGLEQGWVGKVWRLISGIITFATSVLTLSAFLEDAGLIAEGGVLGIIRDAWSVVVRM